MSMITTEQNIEITEEAIQSVLGEINQNESIDYYISTLSPEEIHSRIELYKKIVERQLMQLKNLVETIDQKIGKINSVHNPIPAGNALTSSSSAPRLEDISCIRKKHQNRLQELEREFDSKLKESIDKMEKEHGETMTTILDKHDAKVVKLYKEMEANQTVLDQYNDSTKYITIKEHDAAFEQLKLKYENEIKTYDEDIAKLEGKIKESYPQLVNKPNNSMMIPNMKNVRNRNLSAQIEEFIMKMKNGNGNDNMISLVSNMSVMNDGKDYVEEEEVKAIGNDNAGNEEGEGDEDGEEYGDVLDNENLDTINNEEFYYEREEDHDVAEFSDNEEFNPKNIALYSELTRFKKDNSK